MRIVLRVECIDIDLIHKVNNAKRRMHQDAHLQNIMVKVDEKGKKIFAWIDFGVTRNPSHFSNVLRHVMDSFVCDADTERGKVLTRLWNLWNSGEIDVGSYLSQCEVAFIQSARELSVSDVMTFNYNVDLPIEFFISPSRGL